MRGAVVGLVLGLVVLIVAAGGRALLRRRSVVAVRRRLPAAPRAVDLRETFAVPQWFTRRVALLDLPIEPTTLWRRYVAAAATAAVVGALVAGAAASVVAVVVVASLPFVLARMLRDRRARRVEAQVPALLDTVGSSLRAGSSFRQALLEAANSAPPPLGAELAPVVRAANAGGSLAPELERWSRRTPSPAVRLLVAVATLGLRDGGPQRAAVDGVASTVRDRLAVGAEIRALSSQARASALVIVFAPILFAAVAAIADPTVLAFLVSSPIGILCLVGGVVLDGGGALWMARIMRNAR
ncbi:MAG: type II secretion system F family protein [Actinobacteria bacterium]|nr:type II secretion system F family protein [Actinomycetota bacterium]